MSGRKADQINSTLHEGPIQAAPVAFRAEVRLHGSPHLHERESRQIREDFEKFRLGLPPSLEGYVLDRHGIDLASVYGGVPLKNPFGKASGQLSLARHQVEKDATGGLGFVVLKTVIAQDASGEQMMREWAIPETRMQVGKISSRSGAEGWNVTWKGRGWFNTFEAYRQLFDETLVLSQPCRMLVAPSVKYHLPMPEETSWKVEEYAFTTGKLVETWTKRQGTSPMPLEKDFSPTLAGSSRAAQQAKILEWLRTVPGLIHRAAAGRARVGMKIFNTLFEDEFQLRMLETVHENRPYGERADFLVYANRLFDPSAEFEGKTGVAYGGPDLSDRNLAILERFLSSPRSSSEPPGDSAELLPLPLSATGDIHSGRVAVEYLLRGASSFQMHTLFQLRDSEFSMSTGTKTQKTLHHLLFHPHTGFIPWFLHVRRRLGTPGDANIHDAAQWCRNHWSTVSEAFKPQRRRNV